MHISVASCVLFELFWLADRGLYLNFMLFAQYAKFPMALCSIKLSSLRNTLIFQKSCIISTICESIKGSCLSWYTGTFGIFSNYLA